MFTRRISPLIAAAALLVALPVAADADPGSPLFRLVDTAAQRLTTAEAVAAYKWINGGAITDPQRVEQVLNTVGEDAAAHGVDADYVRAIFTDQINSTEGIEYLRFSQWEFDGSAAPTSAPDLSESRTAIDGYNKVMVDEIVLQWAPLHSAQCATALRAATDDVVAARALDPLYQQALTTATRSYCPA